MHMPPTLRSRMGNARRAVVRLARAAQGLPEITPGALEKEGLRSLIGKANPVILDIGCNDGWQTGWFLELFDQALVYCFEPDQRALARFRERITDPRAVVLNMAIGANDDHMDFHISSGSPPPNMAEPLPAGWDQSGSLRKPKDHLEMYPWCKFDKTVQVKVARLDTWADQNSIGTIELIWADVQGAELDLIRGGRETLRRTHYFYTEYSNRELYEGQANLRQLRRLLPEFEIVRLFPNDVLFRNRYF